MAVNSRQAAGSYEYQWRQYRRGNVQNTSTGDFSTLLLDINPTYSTTVYPEVWTQFTITISGLANPLHPVALAFRYFVEDGGPNGSIQILGIDDGLYHLLISMLRHTGPGKHAPQFPDIRPVTNFSLSVSNTLNQSGLTYQWQSSPDNITWTNIAGATAATLTTQQNAATWYRLQVTCGGNTGSSAPLLVPMSAPDGMLLPASHKPTVTWMMRSPMLHSEALIITVPAASTDTLITQPSRRTSLQWRCQPHE